MLALTPAEMKEVPSCEIRFDQEKRCVWFLEFTGESHATGQITARIQSGLYSEFYDRVTALKEGKDTEVCSLLSDLSEFDLPQEIKAPLFERVLLGLLFEYLEPLSLKLNKIDSLLSYNCFSACAAFNGLFAFKGEGSDESRLNSPVAFWCRFQRYLESKGLLDSYRIFFGQTPLYLLTGEDNLSGCLQPSTLLWFLYTLEVRGIDLRLPYSRILRLAGTFNLNQDWTPRFQTQMTRVDPSKFSYALVAGGAYGTIKDENSFKEALVKCIDTGLIVKSGHDYYLSEASLAYSLHKLAEIAGKH